jgi:hypothetical protein
MNAVGCEGMKVPEHQWDSPRVGSMWKTGLWMQTEMVANFVHEQKCEAQRLIMTKYRTNLELVSLSRPS